MDKTACPYYLTARTGLFPRSASVILSKSSTSAVCSLLGRCGGCVRQDAYEQQLARKRDAIVGALAPFVDAEKIGTVRGLKRPFGYRTKLLMPAAMGRAKQGPTLGFYERGTSRLVDALGCPVQHPLTLSMAAMVRQVLAGSPVRASLPNGREGWLHGVGVRVDPQSGACEVVLCGRTPKVPGGHGVVERLASLPGLSGLHVTAQPRRTSYLLGDDFKLLSGRRRIVFHLLGEEFHLSPGAFFQTSHQGAELLGELVREKLPENIGLLADIYGGVGVFTRLLAERWNRAVIAEAGPAAVADAKSWVKGTGQKRVHVVPGSAEHTIAGVLGQGPDAAVIDPPRSGCHPSVIRALCDSGPPIILYVACSLDSLSRDTAALVAGGYRLESVDAVDMFPHTPHVETVARMVRAAPD